MLHPLVVVLVGVMGAPPPEPPAATTGDTSEPVDSGRTYDGADIVDSTTAEALYRQGEQAYWLGDFDQAVEKFEAAYAASRLPALRPATALLAAGGLVLAGGVATTIAFALKGRSFSQQLVGLRAEQSQAGCADMSSATCDYLADAARITTDNGRRANLLAGGLGGGLTALGAAGLIVGAVLYPRDRPPGPARARLHLAPLAGGLLLHGRF